MTHPFFGELYTWIMPSRSQRCIYMNEFTSFFAHEFHEFTLIPFNE